MVTGNSVADIFMLTDEHVYNALMKDMEDKIRISMEAKKNKNTKEISFDIVVEEIGDPDTPIPYNLPRNKRKQVRKWVEKNIGAWQGVTTAVEAYVSQAIDELLPVLEKKARLYCDIESVDMVYYRLVNEILKRAGKNSPYQIKIFPNRSLCCVKGTTAFKNLLTSLELSDFYHYLDVLRALKARNLVEHNHGREYSFQIKNEGWWYAIRYDAKLLKKAYEEVNYEKW